MVNEDQSKKEEEFHHEKYIYERYIRSQYGIIERIRWRITKKVRSIKDNFKWINNNPVVAIILAMMFVLFLSAIVSVIFDIYVWFFPRVEETTIPRYIYYKVSNIIYLYI